MLKNICIIFISILSATILVVYLLNAQFLSSFVALLAALFINNIIAILVADNYYEFNFFKQKTNLAFWIVSIAICAFINISASLKFIPIFTALWLALWLNILVNLITENRENIFNPQAAIKNKTRFKFTILSLLITALLLAIALGFYNLGF